MLNLLALVQGVEHIVLILFVIGYFISRAWYSFLSSRLPLHSKPSAKQEVSCELALQAAATERVPPQDEQIVAGLLCPLPADLCGRIATFCGFQGVGVLAASCTTLQSQLWESEEVWLALSTIARLPSGNATRSSTCEFLTCPGREAREAFRRATFRTDLVQLRSLAAVGRPQAILFEAAHVAAGLLPGDLCPSALSDFIHIASRSLGAHDPECKAAILAAEGLLRAARRFMELFTEEQLENLEYAYRSVHQLHQLMLSSMKDAHQEVLQQSFFSIDTVLAEDQEFREFLALYGDDEVCAQ